VIISWEKEILKDLRMWEAIREIMRDIEGYVGLVTTKGLSSVIVEVFMYVALWIFMLLYQSKSCFESLLKKLKYSGIYTDKFGNVMNNQIRLTLS